MDLLWWETALRGLPGRLLCHSQGRLSMRTDHTRLSQREGWPLSRKLQA